MCYIQQLRQNLALFVFVMDIKIASDHIIICIRSVVMRWTVVVISSVSDYLLPCLHLPAARWCTPLFSHAHVLRPMFCFINITARNSQNRCKFCRTGKSSFIMITFFTWKPSLDWLNRFTCITTPLLFVQVLLVINYQHCMIKIQHSYCLKSKVWWKIYYESR